MWAKVTVIPSIFQTTFDYSSKAPDISDQFIGLAYSETIIINNKWLHVQSIHDKGENLFVCD